jgi:uncharacterized NAD-dependent epimerase/dehydratase family protein
MVEYDQSMAETKGELVKKIAATVRQNGKHVTDEQAREAIAREYNDFVVEAYDPSTPAPELSREQRDEIAEHLMSF